MGFSTEAVLYVGKWFNDDDEAFEFAKQHIKFSEKDLKEINHYGFPNYCDEEKIGTVLNSITGKGFLLGYEVDVSNLIESFAEALTKWNNVFVGIEPETLLGVVTV